MIVRYTGRQGGALTLRLVGECGGGRALVERLDCNGKPKRFAVLAKNLTPEPDLFDNELDRAATMLQQIRSVWCR